MEDVKCICGENITAMSIQDSHRFRKRSDDPKSLDKYFLKSNIQDLDNLFFIIYPIKYYPYCQECGNLCKECFKWTYKNNNIFQYFFQYLLELDKKYEKHVYKTQSCINCTLPPK